MSLSRFERALLSSGAQDGPPDERKKAARAAVLQAAGVSAIATGAGLTGADGAATATKLSFGKLLVFAAIGIGAASVIIVATRTPSPAAPAASLERASEMIAETLVDAAIFEAPSLPTMNVEALPVAAPSSSSASVSAARASAARPAPEEDPLAAEARLLEKARGCLASGDRACARAHLAEHEMRFPRGGLSDEATVLAIDVATADGDGAEARRLAAGLLARKPDGPWSSRLRKLAEQETGR